MVLTTSIVVLLTLVFLTLLEWNEVVWLARTYAVEYNSAGYTHVEYSSRVDPAFVVYTAGRWLQSCVAQLILSVP